MKILEVNKFFYKKGGSEAYFFDVRELLKSKGHTVMDFAMNHEKNEASVYQKYFSHPVYFEGKMSVFEKIHAFFHVLYSWNVARQLEKMFEEEGVPDVAHLHNFSYQLSPAVIQVLQKHHIPLVWTLHDYKVISPNYSLYTDGGVDECTKPDAYFQAFFHKSIKNSYTQSFLASLEQWLHVKVTRWYRSSDVYVAPSVFMRDTIIEYGIPKEEVTQVYNFIHMSEYEPDYSHDGAYMFVGRFVREKGVMEMLSAFKQMPDVRLDIIGGGPLQEEMQAYIDEHKMSQVRILGAIYPPQMYGKLARAKALIMPSVWYENNPIIMLQAMALGKPIVGARIGGIPELIVEGKTGITYDPFDTQDFIRAVRACEGMDLAHMGMQARELVEKIASPEVHYEQLMEVFEHAINKRRHVL